MVFAIMSVDKGTVCIANKCMTNLEKSNLKNTGTRHKQLEYESVSFLNKKHIYIYI